MKKQKKMNNGEWMWIDGEVKKVKNENRIVIHEEINRWRMKMECEETDN